MAPRQSSVPSSRGLGLKSVLSPNPGKIVWPCNIFTSILSPSQYLHKFSIPLRNIFTSILSLFKIFLTLLVMSPPALPRQPLIVTTAWTYESLFHSTAAICKDCSTFGPWVIAKAKARSPPLEAPTTPTPPSFLHLLASRTRAASKYSNETLA